jgi:hypothetical protein
MHLHLTILLLFPLVAHAQEPARMFQYDHLFGLTYFASTADSVDFTAFRSAMRPTDPSQDGDTTTVNYRLVWVIAEHGGVAAVSRGTVVNYALQGARCSASSIASPSACPMAAVGSSSCTTPRVA